MRAIRYVPFPYEFYYLLTFLKTIFIFVTGVTSFYGFLIYSNHRPRKNIRPWIRERSATCFSSKKGSSMTQIGIIYGSTTGNTARYAKLMQEFLGKERADLVDISQANAENLARYPNLIMGISTWGYGDVQEDWGNKLAILQNLNLQGKRIALFGLGDQEAYPATFADAMGTLYQVLVDCGANPIGTWSTEGYSFDASTAIINQQFVGLVLDEDNQADKNTARVETWLQRLEDQWRP
jgi:flavodoxin I